MTVEIEGVRLRELLWDLQRHGVLLCLETLSCAMLCRQHHPFIY